jgi:hypothetical protein
MYTREVALRSVVYFDDLCSEVPRGIQGAGLPWKQVTRPEITWEDGSMGARSRGDVRGTYQQRRPRVDSLRP